MIDKWKVVSILLRTSVTNLKTTIFKGYSLNIFQSVCIFVISLDNILMYDLSTKCYLIIIFYSQIMYI